MATVAIDSIGPSWYAHPQPDAPFRDSLPPPQNITGAESIDISTEFWYDNAQPH